MTEYKTEAQKKKFYKSGAWNKLRQLALDRDNCECQECKREGRVHVDSKKIEGERKSVELNVHHKYEIEHYPQLALVIDNLETLCLNCHNKMHDRVLGEQKKKKWDDERWEHPRVKNFGIYFSTRGAGRAPFRPKKIKKSRLY